MDTLEDNFSPEERDFQTKLIESDFSRLPVHDCLRAVDTLLDDFISLKEHFSDQIPEKRYSLIVQLQLLKAKNSYLMERCFEDDDALARFFFLHERISSIHDTLEKNPSIEQPSISSTEEKAEESEEDNFPLLSESDEEELQGEFECPVCFDIFSYKDTMKLKECGHRFCKECFDCYFTSIINGGGDVCTIQCMNNSCDCEIHDNEIRTIISKELMEKYERFSLLAFLNSNPDAHWCPFPDCDNVMITDPGQQKVRCNKCFRSSCVECKTKWHTGMSCKENQVNTTPEDEQTLKWKRKHGVKPCPYCGQLTIRISGCPDILCSGCKNHWDWHSVGEKSKESVIERVGFFYPRTMKRVVGSRDVIEDWKKDRKQTAKEMAPFMIASTVLGIPLFCVTGPPAYLTKKFRGIRQSK